MVNPRFRSVCGLGLPFLFVACSTVSPDRSIQADRSAPEYELGYESAAPQIAQTPSTRSSGKGGFRFDETHVEAFYMPFYTIEADEPSGSGEKSNIENGQGFGVKLGIGDDDQGIGLLYMSSWNDEATTGTTLTSHALYANFHARGLFWRSRSAKGWARFDGGLGMAGIDFSNDFSDQTSGALNLRGAIQLEFNDKFSVDMGLGGYLWGVPGDTLAYGAFMTLGGSLRF